MSAQEKGRIVLDEGFDQCGRVASLFLEGERTHSLGAVKSTHEYSVSLKPLTLVFAEADSIDFGSVTMYNGEEEFEAAFPGVMDAVREAASEGRLDVRVFRWDPEIGRNVPTIVPYGEYRSLHMERSRK